MKKLLTLLTFGLLATAAFAQEKLCGTWNTENNNTLVKIEKTEGAYKGIIISSDDKEVKPGTQIIKDVEFKKDKWVGKIYAPKRDTWYDIDLEPTESVLFITAHVGFFSKTIEWTKTDN